MSSKDQDKKQKDLKEKLAPVSEKLKADIILYSGEIDRDGANDIVEATSSPANKNVLLLLCTPGGFPGDAYKIAKRLQCQYERFYLYVYGWCKSAGTLVAIGSDEIIMSDLAEFGPLDVQVTDGEEIGRLSSGLNVFESIQQLKAHYNNYFAESLLWLVKRGGLSTKNAASISASLATGLFSPILANVDPLKVGELGRAMAIGMDYGKELINNGRGNIEEESLIALATQYNDHGYVIDFDQAERIFKEVRRDNELERALGVSLKQLLRYPYSNKSAEGKEQIVKFLYGKEVANDAGKKKSATRGKRKSDSGSPKEKRNNISKFDQKGAAE